MPGATVLVNIPPSRVRRGLGVHRDAAPRKREWERETTGRSPEAMEGAWWCHGRGWRSTQRSHTCWGHLAPSSREPPAALSSGLLHDAAGREHTEGFAELAVATSRWTVTLSFFTRIVCIQTLTQIPLQFKSEKEFPKDSFVFNTPPFSTKFTNYKGIRTESEGNKKPFSIILNPTNQGKHD